LENVKKLPQLRPGVPHKLNIGLYKTGISTSHRYRTGTHKKTWPARHSKKPTLVEGVQHHFSDLL